MIAKIPQCLLAIAFLAGCTIASPMAAPTGDAANLCKTQDSGTCTLQLELSTYEGDDAVQPAWIWDNECNMIGSSDNDTNADANVIRWSCNTNGCSLDSQLGCTVDIFPSWTSDTENFYDTSYLEYAGVTSGKSQATEGSIFNSQGGFTGGSVYNRLITFDCTSTCS